MVIKIGYDAGHGIDTPGKRTPDGEREWSFNNKVATSFANELALYSGLISRRFDDPTGKRDVPLRERTDGANNWGADYYISFHHNALGSQWGNHTGVETFVYTQPSPRSVQLANAIHPALVAGYGLRDRGIKSGNLHIVRETNMPAILVEGGFMDSLIDIKKLRDDALLANVGKLLAQAFCKFVGVSKIVTAPTPTPKPTPTTKEELTVAQYDELKKEIADLRALLNNKADVNSTAAVEAVHEEHYKWAIEVGLTDGSNPRGALTRQQLFTVLKRYHDTFVVNTSTVTPAHKKAWEQLIALGVTDGSNPRALATREQVGTMLQRVMDLS
ncbi:MAG TPA: N-acetylmuramoyl-L-alanine amidase [Ureibacillus sp.]|nr:N-acetylmuramoyl-L-alanine amidase [Ureibacillus sp.]